MINARKIDRIAFTNYKEARLPVFDMEKIERTSVCKYWLMRACRRVICNFMNHASCNSDYMDDLVIAACTMRPQEFGEIVMAISEAILSRMKLFSFDDITRLLSFTTKL